MRKNSLAASFGMQLKSWLWIALVFSMAGILPACSDGPDVIIPPQKWEGMDVRVESRPSPPRTGMNEFIVMLTGERGRPIYDVIVSLRTDDHDAWTQAIQDGQLGIYRRAVEVEPGSRSILQVQIKGSNTESVLRFPLALANGRQ